MIRKFAGHDTDSPPGTVTLNDYVKRVEEQEERKKPELEEYEWRVQQQGLTKPPQVCYTITMPLKDFKREATNAYYNRDIEALTALLDKVIPC